MARRARSTDFVPIFILLASVALSGAAQAYGPKEHVLYRFAGGSDGFDPQSALTADGMGTLYGTTNLGGGGAACASGCGTVFQLVPPSEPDGAWTESVIYSFQGGADGANPLSALIADDSGNLYGATSQGGGACGSVSLAGCGTVFELQRPAGPGAAWSEFVLYSFQGNPLGHGDGDAAWPNGLVFDAAGNLYGFSYEGGHCTTDETGTYCNGTAFRLNKPVGPGALWSEEVLYRFRGATGAPAGPPVLDSSGNLYGKAAGGSFGFGRVFLLKQRYAGEGWREKSLYDFQGTGDGGFPVPGLARDNSGNLYGATLGPGFGVGNVFELSPTRSGPWTDTVLYGFTPPSGGYVAMAGPTLGRDGQLFGTTAEGGQSGFGTVYALTPQGGTWSQSVLHSFGARHDGVAPESAVIEIGHKLYGVTAAGGNTTCGDTGGCGTVFEIVP